MKNLSIVFGLLFLILFVESKAQTLEKCGTMHNYKALEANNPTLKQQRVDVEAIAREWLNQNKKQGVVVATIPVVFHVVHNLSIPEQNVPDSILYSQLEVLNNDYRRTNADTVNTRAEFDSLAADIEIEFCLANVDPTGSFTTGINRVTTTSTDFSFSPFNNNVKTTAGGGVEPWPTTDYLNIWVCDMYSGGSPLVLGYAQFPGDDPATDGVVMTYQHTGSRPWDAAAAPANLGRTASHEVGHYFGLRHIWGDGACDSTDYVTDTPNASAASQQICTLTNNTCNDPLTEPYWNGYDPPDMLENYMDYSTDACMNMFTKGQKDRMWSFLNTARSTLLSSTKCDGLTGIEDIMSSDNVIIYPNPSSDMFTIEWPGEYKFERMEVVDLVGKTILTENMTNVYAKYVVNTQNISEGIYFVKLINGNKITTSKIMISK